MYKRHFISKLIGTRHYIVLIGLLTLIVQVLKTCPPNRS